MDIIRVTDTGGRESGERNSRKTHHTSDINEHIMIIIPLTIAVVSC